MRFDVDILEKARAEALLRFWGKEVTAEVTRATQGSSEGGVLASLGFGITQDDAQAVADRLVANGFSDFLSRAPGIEPYFRRREESIGHYLEEVVANVNAHEERIVQELLGGKRPTAVRSMKQASFTYRGAKSVLIITTDAGKFLYKPHTMRYSTMFGKLCENLLPGKARVPRVIDCGDACLCEYVECVPPANDQERSAYYEGLGGYLALAYFLSLTDQHAENILPVGPRFAPIDVETLLLAFPAIRGVSPHPDDPTLRIRSSIASTGMLSYCDDRLIGSLIAGTKGKGITPIGTSTEAIDHLDIITKGFTETFRRCLQNKRMISEAIISLADVDLRILMGPGSFYQGLQSRFFALDGWDEEKRLQDLDEILSSTRFKRVNQAVCAHERAILVEHDIPYFTIKAGGTDLLAEGEVIWKDYLAEPLVETAIRHVEEADEDALEWQVGLLRKLVGGMPLMSKTRVPDIQPQNEPLTAGVALEEAEWVLHRLFEEQVDCGQSEHAIMAFGDTDGSYSPMDASFSWGYAGVGAFAAACQRVDVGDPGQAQELVDLCLDELSRNACYLGQAPEMLLTAEALNLKTGIAGQLRALQLMWSATQSDKARKTYTELLSLLDTADLSNISDAATLGALTDLAQVLAHEVPGLPRCACREAIIGELSTRAADVRMGSGGKLAFWQSEHVSATNTQVPDSHQQEGAAESDVMPSLQNRDDLLGGNAGVVEQLISSGRLESAGMHLAAMVARRRETGNYIHKGAWRVPYFDPTLFQGAVGVGYELLRYARPDVIEPLFMW